MMYRFVVNGMMMVVRMMHRFVMNGPVTMIVLGHGEAGHSNEK